MTDYEPAQKSEGSADEDGQDDAEQTAKSLGWQQGLVGKGCLASSFIPAADSVEFVVDVEPHDFALWAPTAM